MIFTGSGIVWDGENDSRLCKFTENKFETEDKRTIDILTKLGYEELETDFIDVEYKEVEMTYLEMKAHCKEKGYKDFNGLKKEDLKKFIEGMEV